MLLARPRFSISIILDLNVPSLRVRFCSCMKFLAFFHLPFSRCRRKMQSMAWSFSSMDLILESFLSVRMVFISSSGVNLLSQLCSLSGIFLCIELLTLYYDF